VAALASGTAAAADQDAAALKKGAVKATIKTVKKKLPRDRTPGLAPSEEPVKVKVTSCKQKLAGGRITGFLCAWNAHGELPGRVLLRCKGKAKVRAGATKAKKVKCRNLEELQAPLLANPHPIEFGYFEDFSTIQDLWDELKAGGATLMREGITWTVLQPNAGSPPSSWNWAGFDAVYNQALAVGVRPVFTFRNAPCWAAVQPCQAGAPNPPDPSHYGDYAAAAAEIAKRYPQLAAIELWFEPNSKMFWGATANPAGFSSLVGQAAGAVHATGTGVQVWTGGLAPGMADPDKIEYGTFLSQALDAGGIQAADAIAFHAVTEVPFKPGDDPTAGYLGRLRVQIQTLKTALAAHGVAKPIVFTQLSYSSAPGEYTEAQQAEALVSSYELLLHIADIPDVIVSRLLDNGDGSKVQGFGVLHADRTPKPAYCGLAAARGAAPPPGC
jgi:hypothetical protein